MKASGRTQYYQGPTQIVQGLKQNSLYAVEAYVKLLTDKPGDVVGQNIEINFAFGFSDKTTAYIGVAGRSMVLTKDGYVKMIGDLVTPSKAFISARFYFQGPIPGQEFVVDSTKITSLPETSDYLTTTNQVINQKRKSNINVKVTTAAGIDVNQLQIQINQVKKGFPFGTAVACDEYVSGDQRYQDFINAHFNWAVTENALKWGQMERQPGVLRNETAIAALKKLKSHGIKIRAHNMFWSVPKFVQSWVKALTPTDLRKTVVNRIHTVMGQTQGLVEHWDVNNENLHGQYYQEKLQDRDFNLDLFRMAHQFDPTVKLFLNDYTVVAQGGFTGAYLAQALKFKNSNTGIYGIGVQCHFPANSAPNPTLIKAHLDTLAQAGLPIWVTELDVSSTDENERADWYETALRAFYGHPAVEGIMFWGFWSNRQSRGVPGSLVTGDEFRINPAGQRVLDLFENQWMTKESKIGTEAGQPFTVRGFHGDYEVKVIYNGKERSDLKQTFTLDPNDQTININVQ
ncbi:uncharacterized protein LOC126820755 [Patella vulgata]|uniref:uncharacterized protein LOC126820755 n=1 Tax=Patella vulgata TaxID=6465 RepID=UPI00217FAA1A|nr:uncharacterized protein LOC126820755 [Patella vulgata]